MNQNFGGLLFPGEKRKALTFSYDDGVVQDRRLADLFRQFGLKCTFNLNFGELGRQEFLKPGETKQPHTCVSTEELAEIYAGHEIGGHGLYHSALNNIGTPLALREIYQDKADLEEATRQQLIMFAHPYGTYDANVLEMLRLAGYQGARTIKSSYNFYLPESFMDWNPTCHHDDPRLTELAHRFIASSLINPRLFYVWGHSFEFDKKDNWNVIETLCEYLSAQREQVWFATNGEIIRYVSAYRRLEFFADGNRVYNPSVEDVTVLFGSSALLLKAGQITDIA